MAEIDPFSMLEVSFASVKDEELELDSSPPADRPGQGARTRKAKVMAEGIETIDIPNDSPFHVPLMFGWRREVVLRLNSSSSKADVYYIPPQGKKCRSLRDVEKLIQGTQLTLDGFTFVKKLLGVNDPSKELLRSASNVMPFKKTSSIDSGDTTSSPPHKRVKHAKVKPELQTEERPDVTERTSVDDSSDLGNGAMEVTGSSDVLMSLNLRPSTCSSPTLEGSFSNQLSSIQVPSSTTDVTSSEPDRSSIDMPAPQVFLHCCSCEMCCTMDEKSFCCSDIPNVAAVKSDFQCITHHPSFEKLILDNDVLSITRHMLSLKTKNKNKKNLLNTITPLNITWRYIAYKQFVSWINGSIAIGSRFQVAIPSCVVNAVREKYPEHNGSYKVLKFSA
uniref:MBD domain-containing protein n=1 Tax=Lygus hesperus TaxID=30085 RepID=A0A146LY13_LYGHE